MVELKNGIDSWHLPDALWRSQNLGFISQAYPVDGNHRTVLKFRRASMPLVIYCPITDSNYRIIELRLE